MRLRFVSHSIPPRGRPMANLGGMQRVALKLHEALEESAQGDHDLDYDSHLLRSSWRWVHVRTPFFLLHAAGSLIHAARNDDVDVVLFSSMVTAALAVPLRGFLRRHNVQTAAIVHGLDVTTPFPPYQWFVPHVFEALDAVFPVSRATARACRERTATAEQLHVIPNGIDSDRFHPPADRSDTRTALDEGLDLSSPPTPPDGLLLCSVGRQVERKGTAWFLQNVMPSLPQDVHYWIAGEGPQDRAIQTAINRHGLAPQVQRLGRISNDDLARLYRAADLFVMPNIPVEDDLEGFGIVLLEAAQCGTPAIAAELDGIQDVITEGINGHLVPPEDARAFRELIMRYREAPNELSALAERALNHTTSTFSWRSVAELYRSTLETLHSTGTPPSSITSPPIENTES